MQLNDLCCTWPIAVAELKKCHEKWQVHENSEIGIHHMPMRVYVRETLFAFILANMVLELQQLPLLKTFQMVSESVLDQLRVATSMGFECSMGKPHLNMPLNGNIKCFIENMCLPSIVHSHVTFKYLWIRFNLMNWRIWMLLFDAFALFNCQVVALLSHEDSSFYNNLRPKTSESWITCAELVGILDANSHLMKLM